jgi:hypothetical protein
MLSPFLWSLLSQDEEHFHTQKTLFEHLHKVYHIQYRVFDCLAHSHPMNGKKLDRINKRKYLNANT